MEAAEVRQLTTILVVTGDLLNDIVSAGPRVGLPAGLWQPIAESLSHIGSPRRVVQFEDGAYGLMKIDAAGLPVLVSPQPGAASGPALERAARFLILESGDIPGFDDTALLHGLRGSPLAMKTQVVQLGYEAYVAGGRVTEISTTRPGLMRRAFSRLKDALGPCTTVLDSLSELPQMGYVKVAGEGVETVQHAIGFARARSATT